MKAFLLALTAAVVLAAGVSAAQASSSGPAARAPHALWYRATLSVKETVEYATEAEASFQTAEWGGTSTVAFIVNVFCRNEERVLADESCDEAARCPRCRRPRGSFDDLSFNVGLKGTLTKFSLQRDVLARQWDEPSSNSNVRCSGHSEKLDLIKPARYAGMLGTASLVHDGLSLDLRTPALEPGVWEETIGDEVCTRTFLPLGDRPASSYDTVRPGHHGVGAQDSSNAIWGTHFSPVSVGRLLEAPNAIGLHGGAFAIHRKYSDTAPNGANVTVNATLTLKPCPRGGRAVRRC